MRSVPSKSSGGSSHCASTRAVDPATPAAAKRTMVRDRELTQYRRPASSTDRSFRLRTPAPAGTCQSARTTYGDSARKRNGSPLRPSCADAETARRVARRAELDQHQRVLCFATSRWPFGSTCSDSPRALASARHAAP